MTTIESPKNGETATEQHKYDTVDGVDHINIWAQGDTELGRMLAHYHPSKFTHPAYGPFNCMEGFWHYMKTKEKDDQLRVLIGSRAKDYGRTLTKQRCPHFREIITDANFYKIEQNPKLKQLFIESVLPFEHYYIFKPTLIRIHPKGYEWLIESFETIRKMFRENRRPVN